MDQESKNNADLKEALRNFDMNVNVFWPLVHYKSAVRYLQEKIKMWLLQAVQIGSNTCPQDFKNVYFFLNYGRKRKKKSGEKVGL